MKITDLDLHLFNEGKHYRLYEKLGAHPLARAGRPGVHFAVWAPNARAVSVIGDFNSWKTGADPLAAQGTSGIWAGWLPDLEKGSRYKYHVESRMGEFRVDKADPFAFLSEPPPATASVVWWDSYQWQDAHWMETRAERQGLGNPTSIYEIHLGSWRRHGDGRPLSYLELAEALPEHVRDLGYTHVELMPVMEHPFHGSWGYQITSYFAPSHRYGTPDGLKALIDRFHSLGIGVILDWVPSHFPADEHGLAYFDGTHLFEHADRRLGFHPDWNSLIFNYGRNEVRSFLISSAFYWLDTFHADGIRVDAVASMLYRDYSRREGEWIPNPHGGRENLEAIDFLRQLNVGIYGDFPSAQTYAEESTAWPMVSRPVYLGGLGFGMKWDMGWMHDTLKYFCREPLYRKYHHGELTFRLIYAFTENFVLALSHDEVVHGKGSLASKMPGDHWQKLANLRLLYTYMYAQPGKKLLFMGGELAQLSEWDHDGELDWRLLENPAHQGVRNALADLNRIYSGHAALHARDFSPEGFEWIDVADSDQSILSFLRKEPSGGGLLAVVLNFTPVPRFNYRVGVPRGGSWEEIFNSDSVAYGGSGHGNLGSTEAAPAPAHGRPFSLNLVLPPLGGLILRWKGTSP